MDRSQIKIHNADCMEAMNQMSDNEFDLAIVDPPYGLNEWEKKNNTRSKLAKPKQYTPKSWDSSAPNFEYFKELKRVSKNHIIWGANHFISKMPFDSSCWIVWDKDNGQNDFADCELAWTSFKTSVRKFKWKWHGMLQQDMKNKEHRIHPTQKPVQLYKWLLSNYANEGDKILDTHLGSGSIAIACHDLKFDLTGYEIDKEYYDNAMERIERHKRQMHLF